MQYMRGCVPLNNALKILSIEDDPADQVLIRHILEKEGFEVISMSSLLRATHHLGTHPGEYCFILSDWNLPPYDGVEVAETLENFKTPFGFFTGYSGPTPLTKKYPIWCKSKGERMAQGIKTILSETRPTDETQPNLLRPGWYKDPLHGIKQHAPAELISQTEPQHTGLGV